MYFNPFALSIPVGTFDDTDIVEGQPPQVQGSDLTSFAILPLPDNPLLDILTDFVSKLEEQTDDTLITVNTSLKIEIGRFDSRLTNLRSSTNNRFTSQYRTIGSLYDDFIYLTRVVAKLKDGLSQIQVMLDAQTETLSNLGRVQNSILAFFDGFATENTEAEDRLSPLEAVPTFPVSQSPLRPATQLLVSIDHPPFTAALFATF